MRLCQPKQLYTLIASGATFFFLCSYLIQLFITTYDMHLGPVQDFKIALIVEVFLRLFFALNIVNYV